MTAEQRDLLQKLGATFQTAESKAAESKTAFSENKKKDEKSESKKKGFFGKMKEAVEDLLEDE